MNKISVVLTVLNEEKKIKASLESVKWADEIIIVDDGSTDKTIEIAKNYTDKVFHHVSAGFVEPARNFAISKATGDWILILDADEIVPNTLADKLREITQNTQASCVRLPRKNIIFNKWIQHTGWWPDYNIRFFKKGAVTWTDKIHSQPDLKGMVVDLGPQEGYALTHYNYDSISQFLRKLDSYTTVTAKERIASNHQFRWNEIIELPVQEFLSRYFARQGYKDGLHGLVLSLLMAFYEFIISIKIWEQKGFEEVAAIEVAKGFNETIKTSRKNFNFWDYDSKIAEETKNLKKNFYKLRRKIGFYL
jgi:glycosyltransferase involved in cell wall biosynthesis